MAYLCTLVSAQREFPKQGSRGGRIQGHLGSTEHWPYWTRNSILEKGADGKTWHKRECPCKQAAEADRTRQTGENSKTPCWTICSQMLGIWLINQEELEVSKLGWNRQCCRNNGETRTGMLVSVVARNNRQRRKDCKTYEETVHTCSKFRWDKKHRVAKGSEGDQKGELLAAAYYGYMARGREWMWLYLGEGLKQTKHRADENWEQELTT